jgi:hypothetical protein
MTVAQTASDVHLGDLTAESSSFIQKRTFDTIERVVMRHYLPLDASDVVKLTSWTSRLE